jgi:Xaa-Pro aminopeptidase
MEASFYTGNRKAITNVITDGVIVLSGYVEMQRGNDAAHAFEQEAHFWYLTGIDQPGWRLVIDTSNHTSWLIAPDISDVHAIFDGMLSFESAQRISGVDHVINRDEGRRLIADFANTHTTVYALDGHPHQSHFDFVINPAQSELWTELASQFATVVDCRLDITRLRSIKQPVEIAAMQRAIDLTVDAFTHVKQQLPHIKAEYEIEAEFTYAFRKSGAEGHAYDPIVASAKNACTLHYNANQSLLTRDSFVLMDVGARVDGYAADITRTYAYGDINDRQRQVHAAVELAHQSIIELLRPGLLLSDYHDQVDTIMQTALGGLGLLSSDDDSDAYRRYFPHAISHGLGIDVHDSLGGPSELQPGMVLTVEPGIYIPEESIGVRIEDDILITTDGYRNLSAALPTGL